MLNFPPQLSLDRHRLLSSIPNSVDVPHKASGLIPGLCGSLTATCVYVVFITHVILTVLPP